MSGNSNGSVRMPLIHHVVTGAGHPPVVFVHGFACAHSDWNAQVAHLSPRHQTVAVDLRGHGASPGTADECTIARLGADVADVMAHLALPPAVIVGHSMGCRVAVEAASRARDRTAGIVLVDGSQFAAAMEPTLKAALAQPDGFAALSNRWFQDMFTAKSDPIVAAAVRARAARLPRDIGERLMLEMLRYDVEQLSSTLGSLRVPTLAVQTTYTNEKRERRSMRQGQDTPYLQFVRSRVAHARIEIIEDTGHFPQLDESARLNALLDGFLADLS
jgi:pimeloyl-ACP methyl ester carboxylesterase